MTFFKTILLKSAFKPQIEPDNKMMPGSKGQKAVHACMIRLLNLGPAKHEEVVICAANQRIPNVCRIAGAACCGASRGHQLGAKDLLTPTS